LRSEGLRNDQGARKHEKKNKKGQTGTRDVGVREKRGGGLNDRWQTRKGKTLKMLFLKDRRGAEQKRKTMYVLGERKRIRGGNSRNDGLRSEVQL